MKIETFPENKIPTIANPEKKQRASSLNTESLEKAETFEEIKKEFKEFVRKYFIEFSKVTDAGSKMTISERAKKINEMEHIRGQVIAKLMDGLEKCPEARVHYDVLADHDSAVYDKKSLRRIDKVNIPEANAIRDEADIFNSICNYFEMQSNRLSMIKKNYQNSPNNVSGGKIQKTAPNQRNINRIVQEQKISQAIIKNPVSNKNLFYGFLADAQRAYALSNKEKEDFEKAVLGLSSGYLYYSREGRAVFPTAESDATYKTDLYLVKDDIFGSDADSLNETDFDAKKIKELMKEKDSIRGILEIIQTKCTDYPLDASIEVRYNLKSGFEVRRFTNTGGEVVEKTRNIKGALFYLVYDDFRQEAEEYFKHYCIGGQMSGRFTVFRTSDAREIHAEAAK